MDGVSGAFAVVSLAIQLFETVQETAKFVKDIKNAPSEVAKLAETLEQLGSILGYVRELLEQQLLVLRLPGSPTFILNALQNCERKIKPLDKIVKQANEAPDNDNRARRIWTSLKFVIKKEQILELEIQLREAKSDLQFSISANSWQLQQVRQHLHSLTLLTIKRMHHLELTRSIQTSTREAPGLSSLTGGLSPILTPQLNVLSGARPNASMPVILQTTNTGLYNGVLGSIKFQRRTKRIRGNQNNPRQRDTAIAEDLIMITPWLLRRGFELRISSSFGWASRSLKIYPIMMEDAPVFKMCQHGDMDGLQVAFSRGGLSPFVLDDSGRTLLHHAAMYFHNDLCSWLLRLGVDPDKLADYGQTAFQRVAIPGVCDEHGGDLTAFARPIVDTLRVLSQAQTHFSSLDIEDLVWLYRGPPAGLDYLLLQYDNLICVQDGDYENILSHVFATAVSLFGKGGLQWEDFIRRLIRKGADIHACAREGHLEPIYDPEAGRNFDQSPECGTLLDELFRFTDSPFEAEVAANSWLRLLASEGLDLITYLEREIVLHSAQQQLTWASFYSYRKLIFRLDGDPHVWWHWHLDLESSAILVREEYKSLIHSTDIHDFEGTEFAPWLDVWPFVYPMWSSESSEETSWSAYHEGDALKKSKIILEQQRREHLAESRACRRQKKKASKLRRASRTNNASKMPGAWPS